MFAFLIFTIINKISYVKLQFRMNDEGKRLLDGTNLEGWVTIVTPENPISFKCSEDSRRLTKILWSHVTIQHS